jgi:hypothetical protein
MSKLNSIEQVFRGWRAQGLPEGEGGGALNSAIAEYVKTCSIESGRIGRRFCRKNSMKLSSVNNIYD